MAVKADQEATDWQWRVHFFSLLAGGKLIVLLVPCICRSAHRPTFALLSEIKIGSVPDLLFNIIGQFQNQFLRLPCRCVVKSTGWYAREMQTWRSCLAQTAHRLHLSIRATGVFLHGPPRNIRYEKWKLVHAKFKWPWTKTGQDILLALTSRWWSRDTRPQAPRQGESITKSKIEHDLLNK